MALPNHPLSVRYGQRTPIGSILRYGTLRNSAGPHEGRKLAHFCFVYTLAGSTSYEDSHVARHTLRPGDLLLVQPGVVHRYGNARKRRWDECFIVFDGPVFRLWRNGLADPARPIINLQPIEYWHKRMLSCTEGPDEPGLAHQLRQVVNLLGFMTEVFETQAARGPKGDSWLNQSCQRLGFDLAEEINWNEFARSLGMSADHFRKRFTRAMGVSPGRYRTARVIDRACEMIAQGDKLGKEIAAELGFANEQHFSRRFRQVTGMTLTQFRHKADGTQK